MGKYDEVKKIIKQKLEEHGEISQAEVIKILDPYIEIDEEKLKERYIRRKAQELLREYKKKHM